MAGTRAWVAAILLPLLVAAIAFILLSNDAPSRRDAPPPSPIGEGSDQGEHLPLIQAREEEFEEFSSGSKMLSNWRDSLAAPSRMDIVQRFEIDTSVPLSSRIETLTKLSDRGDSKAAIELAVGLAHCAASPTNGKSLESTINELYQTRRVESSVFQIEELDGKADEIRARFEYCEDITQDQILDHFVYARMAAEGDDLEAMSHLTSLGALPQETIFEALGRAWTSEEEMMRDRYRYLMNAAKEGEATALAALGTILSSGDVDLGGTESTRIEAAAYTIAGARLKAIKLVSDEPLRSLAVDRAYNGLSPNELARAMDRVDEILASEKCCVFLE